MGKATCRNCDESVNAKADVCPHCDADHPTDLFIGQVIRDNIELESVLGVGGMGTVYLGVETHLQRYVAVKILNNTSALSDRTLTYFMREAQALIRMRHPNLVSVLDFGQDSENVVFLVLEYIPGQNLSHLLRRESPISHTRALRILIQILGALEEAHRHNIIHRDLKPGNILIEEVAGQKDFVKVLDFGVAKILAEEGFVTDGFKTELGTVVGTPHYMSPEQAQGLELDGRSDIYTAGLVLYEMITGRMAHHSANIIDLMVKRLGAEVAPPSSRFPDLKLPKSLDLLCVKALRRSRDERFETAAAFREAAQAALAELATGKSLKESVLQVEGRSSQGEAEVSPIKSDLRVAPTFVSMPSKDMGTIAALSIKPAAAGSHQSSELDSLWSQLETLVMSRGGVIYPPEEDHLVMVTFKPQHGNSTLGTAAEVALKAQRESRRQERLALKIGLAYHGPELDSADVMDMSITHLARELAHKASPGQTLLPVGVGKLLEDTFLVERDGAHSTLRGILDTQIQPTGDRLTKRFESKLYPSLQRISQGATGTALALVGPRGSGKTHTVQTASAASKDLGLGVFTAFADPNLTDRPFRLLFDLIINICHSNTASLDTSHDDLTSGLKEIGLDKKDILRIVEQYISGTDNDPWLIFTGGLSERLSYAKIRRALHLFPPAERVLSFTIALRNLLRALTKEAGFTIVLEELDQADPSSLACISGLCALTRELPITIIATMTESIPSLVHDFTAMEFHPLNPAETRELWSDLVRESGRGDKHGCTQDMIEAAKGSALYVKRWHERPLDSPPESLSELINQQFKALPNRSRRLLYITSVLGTCFDEMSLTSLFPKSTSMREALKVAQEANWLEKCSEIRGLWRFAHPSLQSSIYSSISPTDRVKNHRFIFERLPRATQGHILRLKAIQAHRAGLSNEAAILCEQLGDRFSIGGDPSSGHTWYARALKSVQDRNDRRDQLVLKYAYTLFISGGGTEARHFLRSTTIDGRRSKARAALIATRMFAEGGNHKTAEMMAIEGLRHIRGADPLASGWRLLIAIACDKQGRHDEAMRQVEVAIELLSVNISELPDDILHLLWRVHMVKGSIAIKRGHLQTAESALRTGIEKAEVVGDTNGLVEVSFLLAQWLVSQGRHREAEEVYLSLLGRSDGRPLNPSKEVLILEAIGEIRSLRGDETGAQEALSQSRQIASQAQWMIDSRGPAGS